jgi:hypothetical protein
VSWARRALTVRLRRAPLPTALLICCLALAACGGSTEGNDQAAAEVGPGIGDSPPLRTFTCTDWNRANGEMRLATIEQIRNFAGGPVTGEGVRARGAVLEDDQAYQLFDRACEPDFASGFLLVKLNTHAAGFAGGP